NIIILGKIDHILLKSETINAIERFHDFDLPTDKTCRFGSWYHDFGASHFSGSKTFTRMEEPHEKFHTALSTALGYIDHGSDDIFKHKQEIKDQFIFAESMTEELFELMDATLLEQEAYEASH
ncbi:MAG: CZB domain-containing protein, partial [Campylobacterota bacterium]|nr:CZB domain-containing protein [Campylobacterota bacterium]